MRKLLILAVLLLVLVSGFSLVSAQEEEDLTILSLTALAAGEPLEAAFEGSVTMQLFAFNALEGDEVTITMEQAEDATIDPFLILVGPRGEMIAYNDDSEDEGDAALASAIVDAELPADGTYLVAATFLGEILGTQLGEDGLEEAQVYTIEMTGASEVEIPEDEPTFQLAGADVAVGQGGTLEVTQQEPIYYLFLQAEEGQTVAITTSAAEADIVLDDTVLYVFDRTGNRIAVVDDVEGNLYAALEFEAAYSGAYLIWATSASYGLAPELGDDFSGIGAFNIDISG
ncbi:MAG: hypothetical protein HXY40_12540 [Chloroflexi bacterium]|nr:hypothetical protein [Chloroflexota bacterium]